MFTCDMADFFSLFRLNKLKPAWEFKAGSLIWRILFTNSNRIVGEARNQATKSTSFFCVDAHSGHPLWKGVQYDEPWWIGIEEVHDQWLILHGYSRPHMPEHQGIDTVEIETGNVLWRNNDLSFWFTHHEKLYANKYLFEKRIGYELDIKTGAILNEYTDNIDVLQNLRKNILHDTVDEQRDIIVPELFSIDRVDPSINEAIKEITGGKIFEDRIDYVLCRGMLLISFYQQEIVAGLKSLNNIFVIYDTKRRKAMIKEIIGKGLQISSPDTFFVRDEFVYFIKNQVTLTALRLWKS